MEKITSEQVLASLGKLRLPGSAQDIVSAGLISDIVIANNRVMFAITVDQANTAAMESLRREAERIVAGMPGIEKVMVALTADIRICSDDAQFGIPAAKLGVGYPYEATSELVALVGPGHASEIMFAGRRIDAVEAERIGLVNRQVPKHELEPTVRALAADIAANAPLSHVAHKRSIQSAARGGPLAERAAIHQAIAAAWASDDAVEGRRAFLERRPSQFTGK